MVNFKDLNISELEKLAFEGNLEAQVNLAHAYLLGENVAVDITKASMWFITAAVSGHHGAIEWVIKRAEEGSTVCQHNLAVMYENGEGVNRDMRFALYFYALAAKQGSKKSLDRLLELNKKYNLSQYNPEITKFLKDFLSKSSQ